jgi:hypothetical protein
MGEAECKRFAWPVSVFRVDPAARRAWRWEFPPESALTGGGSTRGLLWNVSQKIQTWKPSSMNFSRFRRPEVAKKAFGMLLHPEGVERAQPGVSTHKR